MKIGIMTWWHNANYGGFLQGLALQRFMANIGYDAELIKYAFPVIGQHDLIGDVTFHDWKQFIRVLFRWFAALFVDGRFFSRLRRIAEAKRGVRMAKSSSRQFATMMEISQSGCYDVVVVGSDQVWNPYCQDSAYSYLLEGLSDRVARVSYASSVSCETLRGRDNVYADALKKFHAISVRELSAVKLLQPLVRTPISWVVDPTLLLPKEEWTECFHLTKATAERHIMVYWLSDFQKVFPALRALSDKYNCAVHVFSNVSGISAEGSPLKWLNHLALRWRIFRSDRVKICLNGSARDFLQSILTADYVLTDSFHALMFSIIFDKRVKVVVPDERRGMASRIEDFASRICLRDVITSEVPVNFNDEGLKYNKVKLDEWILDSKDYLKQALKIPVMFDLYHE